MQLAVSVKLEKKLHAACTRTLFPVASVVVIKEFSLPEVRTSQKLV